MISGLVATARSLAGPLLLRVLGAGLGFATTLLLTRALQAEGAGIFYGTLAWASALAIIARWGTSDLLLVELPGFANRGLAAMEAGFINRLLVLGLIRSLLIAAISAIALWLAASAGIANLPSAWLLFVLAPLLAMIQLLGAVARSLERPATGILCEFILPPLALLVPVGAVLITGGTLDVTQAGLAYTGSVLISAILAAFMFVTPNTAARLPATFNDKARNRANNFAVAELAIFLNNQAAILILPLMMGPADVGIFNLALRIAATVGLVVTTVNALVIPRLVKAWEQGDAAEWKRTIAHARLMTFLAGCAFYAAVSLAGSSLLGIAGRDFAQAEGSLNILCLGYAIGLALGPSSAILGAAGKEIVARRTFVASSVLSILCLVPAIHLFGLMGAATVASATYVLQKVALLMADLKISPDQGQMPGGQA